jgi:hypothetical protein
MEPTGAMVAAVFVAAAEAALKGTLSAAAKDAYRVLKDWIGTWAADEVQALEKTPDSAVRSALLAEVIDARGADDQAKTRLLAQRLIERLKEAGVPAPAVNLGDIRAGSVRISDSVTGSGNVVGVTIGSTLGVEPVDPWPEPGNPRK